MLSLRSFMRDDAELLQEKQYPDMSLGELEALIDEWNRGSYQGRLFEMLAVVADGAVVGCVSLLARSRSVVSLGVDIFPAERRKGFAGAALRLMLARAAALGFRIAQTQVRTDNAASRALHEKLGFESDGYVYKNAKGRDVVIYLMPI